MKIKEKVTDNEGHVSQMDSMDVTSFPWLCEPICSILQASKRNLQNCPHKFFKEDFQNLTGVTEPCAQ
jgi:hypothetical protein